MNEVYILRKEVYNSGAELLACYFDKQRAENHKKILLLYPEDGACYDIRTVKVAEGETLSATPLASTIPVVDPGAERVAAMSAFCQDIAKEPPSIDENKSLETGRLKDTPKGFLPPRKTSTGYTMDRRTGYEAPRRPDEKAQVIELIDELMEGGRDIVPFDVHALVPEVSKAAVLKWIKDHISAYGDGYVYGRFWPEGAKHPRAVWTLSPSKFTPSADAKPKTQEELHPELIDPSIVDCAECGSNAQKDQVCFCEHNWKQA